jgi:type I restriction enzyme, S subunit
MYGSTRYPTFRVDESRCSPQFLLNYFKTEEGLRQLVKICPGSAGRNRVLSIKRISEVLVPLPPLAEQRRVVARIEELATQIHEARTLRQQAADQAKALLLSAHSAISHPAGSPTISVEGLVGEDGLRNGKSVKSFGVESRIRCLTLSAMRGGRINVREVKPVPMSPEEAAPFQVRCGDVYVIRGNGSKDLCGRAGLITEEAEGVVFPDLFIQVALCKKRILPEFFVTAWNSSATRAVIEEKAKTTSGIWKINQWHILSTRVPVPLLPVQRRIVAELDALQAEVDGLKRLQAETAAELDALLPAILDRAFKGEL